MILKNFTPIAANSSGGCEDIGNPYDYKNLLEVQHHHDQKQNFEKMLILCDWLQYCPKKEVSDTYQLTHWDLVTPCGIAEFLHKPFYLNYIEHLIT